MTAKFEQHPRLAGLLLQTRKRYLIEASPRDRVWGGGKSALQISQGQWDGLNLLGNILAKVRYLLRYTEPDEMLRRSRHFDGVAASPVHKGKGKKGKGKGNGPGGGAAGKGNNGLLRWGAGALGSAHAATQDNHHSLPRVLGGLGGDARASAYAGSACGWGGSTHLDKSGVFFASRF